MIIAKVGTRCRYICDILLIAVFWMQSQYQQALATLQIITKLLFFLCADPGAEVICICKQVECGLVLQCSNRDCLIGQYHAQCVGVQAPQCSTSWLCDGCGK